MDTIKDRIEYLSVSVRALPIDELEGELGIKRGAIANCDKVPLSDDDLKKVADRLNTPLESLKGELL